MLPSPFFAEVPTDLGDGQTWVREVAGEHQRDEFTQRPRTGLRAIVGDRVAAGTLRLVSRLRCALAL